MGGCADDDGWIRIVGYGSLLSERSARRTFPALRDFSLVMIPGACRVFGHSAPVFFERDIASPGPPYRFSSLCAERWSSQDSPGKLDLGTEDDFALAPPEVAVAVKEGRWIAATAFFIPPEAMEQFREREPEFTYVNIQPYALDGGAPSGIRAIMCGRGSDDLFRSTLELTKTESWESTVSKYGIDTVWHHPPSKLFPCQPYLRHCVLSAEIVGVKDNFLDSTFLADRTTSIREYLERNPSQLETPPPAAVADRYTP